MSDKQKQIDPIPEEFASYDEAAEFWDTHDTTDYPENFETVAIEPSFKRRRFEIEIDEDLMVALSEKARERGVAVSELLSELLKDKVRPAA